MRIRIFLFGRPPQSPFSKGGGRESTTFSRGGGNPDSLPLEKGVPCTQGEGFTPSPLSFPKGVPCTQGEGFTFDLPVYRRTC